MAKNGRPIKIESHIPEQLNGKHGSIHLRPIPNQPGVNPNLAVSASRELVTQYPVGTVFLVKALVRGGNHYWSDYRLAYQIQQSDGSFEWSTGDLSKRWS